MSCIAKGTLIASCQANEGEPLAPYKIMDAMARACVEGGAGAIRACGAEDIASIRKAVAVPVIGIIKRVYADSAVYITPTLREVRELLEQAKPQVIALDATARPRPHGERLEDLVRYVRENSPATELMADISTYEEAKNADALGFEYIGTTLRSYTEYTRGKHIPDTRLLRRMAGSLHAKVIAEGGIWERRQIVAVAATGAWAYVVGTAITRPREITARFAEAIRERS